MPRSAGSPNRSTAARREELLARIRRRLHDRAAGAASWRELATAAGVSLSTLTHHFGRRDDVVRAVLAHEEHHGAAPRAIMAQPTGAFGMSVRDAVRHLADAMVAGELDRMIASGLAEGLSNPVLGPAFVSHMLEPMLAAVEARLAHHVAAGEMRADGVRLAAIELAAPVIVAVLHQRPLSGSEVRPLDLDAFVDAHAAAFVRAWANGEERG